MTTVDSHKTMTDSASQAGVQRLATLALACLLLFSLAVVVSQLLRPDLGPAVNFLSEYAIGAYAFVMTAGFAIMGVGILLLTASFSRYGAATRAGKAGMVLLGIAGVAIVLFFVAYPLQAGSEPSVAQLQSVIGIFQRTLIFLIWLWLTVTAARLRPKRIMAPMMRETGE